MNKNDKIFAIICGLLASWIAFDLLGLYGLIFFIIFPPLAIFGLWVTEKIGERKPFVKQVGRFFLTGTFADVLDIKIFQLLFFFLPWPLFFKAISFLAATFIKFWWNKHWAFEKHGKDGIKKEIIQFSIITAGGLAINLLAFNYFMNVIGSQFGISTYVWTELSIIFAALAAAGWNFAGYKFLVFKK